MLKHAKDIGQQKTRFTMKLPALYSEEYYGCYYAMRSAADVDQGGSIILGSGNPAPKIEFNEFYKMLKVDKQEVSWKDLAAPVFVLNAIDRAMKSGEEETVGEVNI